jgi:transposase InsO family protein
MELSVGSEGDSYDNALAEAINALYKAELIHRRAPWKTKEAVEVKFYICPVWRGLRGNQQPSLHHSGNSCAGRGTASSLALVRK